MKLIIGYGNVMCGDDGVGVTVANALLDCLTEDDIQVVSAHQLLPEHVPLLCEAEQVVFVDARANAGQAGIVECGAVKPYFVGEPFLHHLTPHSLLALARDLYNIVPASLLVTVTGANFGYGEGLSAEVKNALPTLLKEVCAALGLDVPQQIQMHLRLY
jgi:hydrogenase maturation protease